MLVDLMVVVVVMAGIDRFDPDSIRLEALANIRTNDSITAQILQSKKLAEPKCAQPANYRPS